MPASSPPSASSPAVPSQSPTCDAVSPPAPPPPPMPPPGDATTPVIYRRPPCVATIVLTNLPPFTPPYELANLFPPSIGIVAIDVGLVPHHPESCVALVRFASLDSMRNALKCLEEREYVEIEGQRVGVGVWDSGEGVGMRMWDSVKGSAMPMFRPGFVPVPPPLGCMSPPVPLPVPLPLPPAPEPAAAPAAPPSALRALVASTVCPAQSPQRDPDLIEGSSPPSTQVPSTSPGADSRTLPPTLPRQLFIGDLSPEITSDLLYKHLLEHHNGVLSARVMIDPVTRRSRGYGFASFETRKAADAARRELDGTWVGWRVVRVSPAREKRWELGGRRGVAGVGGVVGPGKGSGGGRGRGYGGLKDVLEKGEGYSDTVYVGKLQPQTTSAELQTLFGRYGQVLDVRIPTSRGIAFIKMNSHYNAASSIYHLHNTRLHGRCIRVAWGHERGGWPPSSQGQRLSSAGAETGPGTGNGADAAQAPGVQALGAPVPHSEQLSEHQYQHQLPPYPYPTPPWVPVPLFPYPFMGYAPGHDPHIPFPPPPPPPPALQPAFVPLVPQLPNADPSDTLPDPAPPPPRCLPPPPPPSSSSSPQQ